MSATRFTRKTAPRDWLQLSQWIDPDLNGWEEVHRLRFNVLREAITRYVGGETVSTYLGDNDTSWEQFLRAFNRCLARDGRGRQFGWVGLIPHVRVRSPIRTKDLVQTGRSGRGGLSGAMQLFLGERPELKHSFDIYLLENAKRLLGNESRLRTKSAYQYFIKLCEDAKVDSSEWPMNTSKRGHGAVQLYVEAFVHAHYDDIVTTHYGQKAGAKANTGAGFFSRLTASRVYDVVELDEHRAHFIGSIGIPTADGVRWMELQRLTLIAIADRKGAVLGLKVICRREADAEDILDVFDATFGGAPQHTYATTAYDALKGAFPASLGYPFEGCAFNQLLIDNALAHIAAPIIKRARNIAGFDANLGPVGRFERRPVIEGVFNALERLGFHRLRATTGTGPHDSRRQHAEKAAVEARLELHELVDLIVSVLSDANTRTGKPNFGRSHLNFLRDLAADVDGFGMIFPMLPPPLPGVPPLNVSIIPVTVRGSKEKGRRPSVFFEEETYVGKALADRWDLLNKEVVAHVRRADIRSFDLFTKAGEHIDTLTVIGRWRHSAQSLDIRRHINKLIRDGYLKVRYDEDPVHVHQDDLKRRVVENRRAERGVTQGMVAALAEHQRAAAAEAADVSGRTLQQVLSDVRKNDPISPANANSDDDWRLDGLGTLNGKV